MFCQTASNGFTISGPGRTGITSPSTGGAGGIGNITIRNGMVQGMANTGISIVKAAIVEGMQITGNLGNGIYVGGAAASTPPANIVGSIVRDNIVSFNKGFGIATGEGTLVVNNTVVNNNGEYGIFADDGSTVNGNTSRGNEVGILAHNGSTVYGNSVSKNKSIGIIAFDGCTVSDNSVNFNQGDGIEARTGTTVLNNSVRNNTGFGLILNSNSINFGFGNNVFALNNGGANDKQVQGGMQIGSNICGTALCQ